MRNFPSSATEILIKMHQIYLIASCVRMHDIGFSVELSCESDIETISVTYQKLINVIHIINAHMCHQLRRTHQQISTDAA